ncbi:MAG: type II secretion system protein [Phycisphaerales bacterium]|nr:type II secretion system protein [Phycisphaerales bacterium]
MASARPSRDAFTIIEVIIALGIVMMLAGLALPGLSSVRKHGNSLTDLAVLRGDAGLISTYCADFKEVYPISEVSAIRATLTWYEPLVARGYLPRREESDPRGFAGDGFCRFALSTAMLFPAEHMVPGAVIVGAYAESSAVRRSDVQFPGEKGELVQWMHVVDGRHVPWTYNTIDRPRSPIVRTDGSGLAARAVDFRLAHEFFEDWVGHPVLGTWGGCRGTDTLH